MDHSIAARAQILDVRASLYTAVASLEGSLEYGNDPLSVADAAAVVVERLTELKRLLALLEHDEVRNGGVAHRQRLA